MEYHQDWFMRQIQMLVSFLIRLLAGDEKQTPDESTLVSARNDFSRILEVLIERNELCQAENLLYEHADGTNMDVFYAGLLFYQNISRLTEEKLRELNFSRQEITEGICELCLRYGISQELISMYI